MNETVRSATRTNLKRAFLLFLRGGNGAGSRVDCAIQAVQRTLGENDTAGAKVVIDLLKSKYSDKHPFLCDFTYADFFGNTRKAPTIVAGQLPRSSSGGGARARWAWGYGIGVHGTNIPYLPGTSIQVDLHCVVPRGPREPRNTMDTYLRTPIIEGMFGSIQRDGRTPSPTIDVDFDDIPGSLDLPEGDVTRWLRTYLVANTLYNWPLDILRNIKSMGHILAVFPELIPYLPETFVTKHNEGMRNSPNARPGRWVIPEDKPPQQLRHHLAMFTHMMETGQLMSV